MVIMTETFNCLIYGVTVEIVDGVCQQDCSIEDCTLNRDLQSGYKADKEETDSDESVGV
jgi:hypothetical protein